MAQLMISQKVMDGIKENFGKGDELIPEEPKKEKKKRSKQPIILLISAAIVALINVVSWKSAAFSDWYTANIFPFWQKTYGRLTSLAPFSVGEILIGIGIIAIPVSLILLTVGLIRKKGRRLKVFKRFVFFYWWTITVIAVIMTLNCFILYHCSSFADVNGITQREHSNGQVTALNDYLVRKLNERCHSVPRDENGRIIMTADINDAAKYVKNLSGEFKNLDGFYVKPKKIYFSRFMSRLNTMGVYFPFSMEANYNRDMTADNLPNTLCHELAHTKGYIQEDEANFIAYIACEKSGNTEYEYSSYLYAYEKVRRAMNESQDEELINYQGEKLDELVLFDMGSNNDYWQTVHSEETPIVSSEKISEIAYEATETSLKLNGVEDGHHAYNRMVTLMLDYYFTDETSDEMTNAKQ